MNVRNLSIASLVVVLLMTGFAFHVAALLPEGARLPIHWNVRGEADGWMEARAALLSPAGAAALIAGLLAIAPKLAPRRYGVHASAGVLRVLWVGELILMGVVQVRIAAPALGWAVPAMLPVAAVGLLFVAVGNVLPKTRPGRLVGVRTPWTLKDTDNWIATHRLAGRTMIAAGLILAAAGFLPLSDSVRHAAILLPILVTVLLPVAYSWWFSKTKRA